MFEGPPILDPKWDTRSNADYDQEPGAELSQESQSSEEQINVVLARLWHCSGYTTSLWSTPAHTPGHWVLLKFRLYMLAKALSKLSVPDTGSTQMVERKCHTLCSIVGTYLNGTVSIEVNARIGITQGLSI